MLGAVIGGARGGRLFESHCNSPWGRFPTGLCIGRLETGPTDKYLYQNPPVAAVLGVEYTPDPVGIHMPTTQFNKIIDYLYRTTRPSDGDITDGQLLARYTMNRDEAAFAALVRRHGPMVWRVCRRVLGSHYDAADAFQGCFLVLVRKAGSITATELLANWLYGVALRTALHARAAAAKRHVKESHAAALREREGTRSDRWSDLLRLLDEELSHLGDKYRAPILLCDLEGKTRKQAAAQLGIPEGTVAGRLARARALLAKRLSRHGILGLSLAAALPEVAPAAPVPASVVAATLQAASSFAAGETAGAVSAGAVALAKGVLAGMWLTKLKMRLALLFVLGGVVCAWTAWPGREPIKHARPSAHMAAAPKDLGNDTIRDLPAPRLEGKIDNLPQGEADKIAAIDDVIPELRDLAKLLSQPPIARVKQPTTFGQGFRFRFPYGPPGAAITFAVDKPEKQYIWPPKVDPESREGRQAIYETLRDSCKGRHFTMDGNQLLVFGGAPVVPFTFQNERLRTTWPDAMIRVPPARLVEFVKSRHQLAKVTPGPIERSYLLPLAASSYFAALTSDEKVVILMIKRTPEEFQYDVSHYLLEPVAR
jgi:RNA polymerase sigma factor (sigma-70 family)